MHRILALCLCMLLFSGVIAIAQDATEEEQVAAVQDVTEDELAATPTDMTDNAQTAAVQGMDQDKESGAREMSGMSVVGNDEAPKSLYIVPWKSSEIGVATSLDMMLNEGAVPVDRDVFRRQLEFYQVSTKK